MIIILYDIDAKSEFLIVACNLHNLFTFLLFSLFDFHNDDPKGL